MLLVKVVEGRDQEAGPPPRKAGNFGEAQFSAPSLSATGICQKACKARRIDRGRKERPSTTGETRARNWDEHQASTMASAARMGGAPSSRRSLCCSCGWSLSVRHARRPEFFFHRIAEALRAGRGSGRVGDPAW